MSHILLINNGYPTKTKPQYCSYIASIKEVLEQAGHTVDLCVLNVDYSNKLHKLFNYFFFYIKLFRKDYESYDFVFMHHYNFYGFILNKKLKSIEHPVLHWHGSDLFPKNEKGVRSRISSYYFKKLPSKVKHITPSMYFKDQLAAIYNIATNDISVSPSGGVNTSIFTPRIREKFPANKKIKLGFASNLDNEKGIELIIDLINKRGIITKALQIEFEVHYIDYGKDKKYYKSILNKFKDTICWPVMPKSEMFKFYNAIDILIFPTKRESLGLVAIEAMSCGTPVLGTDDFALKEYIITKKSGERFKLDDNEDFIEKLIQLIKHINEYVPQQIVEQKYTKEVVTEFYKIYFSH